MTDLSKYLERLTWSVYSWEWASDLDREATVLEVSRGVSPT